jgi:hypothetical protein
MRESRGFRAKGKKRFALLVDGHDEFWYFQMIKRNNKDLPVDLRPEIPQKKSLSEQYKKVLQLSDDYDQVFWVVDLDVITDETRKTKKGEKPAMDEFKEYTQKLNGIENVTVIINNPCLEFWLLLHFEATGKFYDDCTSAGKQLVKYLPDYQKSQKHYTKEGNDIFLKLKPNLPKAIASAKKLKAFDFENTQIGHSGMHVFFELDEIKGILK